MVLCMATVSTCARTLRGLVELLGLLGSIVEADLDFGLGLGGIHLGMPLRS